jgi:hypothetical protein
VCVTSKHSGKFDTGEAVWTSNQVPSVNSNYRKFMEDTTVHQFLEDENLNMHVMDPIKKTAGEYLL